MMLVYSKEITAHAYLCEVDGMILEHNQTWHNEVDWGIHQGFVGAFFLLRNVYHSHCEPFRL